MELDIEDFDALRHYLTKRLNREPVAFKKLPGGVSNRTVQITWEDGSSCVLKQALAKLRVKEDWFSSPERIHVEAGALRWLNRLAPAGTTPGFLFEDVQNHLMAMQAVPDPHENWKSQLLSGDVLFRHFEQFGSLLGTIQRKSSQLRMELCPAFADTRYFESLRLEPYYLFTAQKIPGAGDFLRALAEETLSHKLSLVHGDFSPKNTLVYQGKLVLLDYEVVHFGDPAFDIGFALAHFLSKANHLHWHRRALMAGATVFWETYLSEVASLGWDSFEPRAVRHALACLLARVEGKSPLEYLTAPQAVRQFQATLFLISHPPETISGLIEEFHLRLGMHANH
jgi:5-methylthioribose kinase